mmetsp:Transcript_30141/g.39449  ORF Transcript_30141/g.39449 Transcript_30141/m.39449 type:complete len:135 (-) Transcript_30141:408-812(-)
MFQLTRTTMMKTTTHVMKSASRPLSTRCAASIEKLQTVLEEYRQVHYSQCMPSRFQKDIVNAAIKAVGDSQKIAADKKAIVPEGLERLLQNIGKSNRLSQSDISLIFSEYGEGSGVIPSDKMFRLLANKDMKSL